MPQYIYEDGKPAFVVITADEWTDLTSQREESLTPMEPIVKGDDIPDTVRGIARREKVNFIGAWRIYVGDTQAVLAGKIGVSQAAISAAEKSTSKPSLTLYKKVAKAYGLNLSTHFELF